ncbi:WD40-repeat-containing domain protein [Cerioporus squamosus]|nr:WD40-repeat-containing domain protein [Cerioporus squamosus]
MPDQGGPQDFPSLLPERLRKKAIPPPWTQTPRPRSQSTRLARFRDGLYAAPSARDVYEACCEVSVDAKICAPIDAAISSDSSVLAVISASGCDPHLHLYRLEDTSRHTTSAGFRRITIEPRLSRPAYALVLLEQHKQAFVADEYRIKSYAWGKASFGDYTARARDNVHTLQSTGFEGPLAVLPGSRIARAGEGKAAIWKLDDLETHEGQGRHIGSAFYDEGTRRDNPYDIEGSSGSAAHMTISFDNRDIAPSQWLWHEPSGKLIASEGKPGSYGPQHYGCVLMDADGRRAARFLGHGGYVLDLSVSPGDAHIFATACSDGYARLFDVRQPLPVMTFNAGRLSEDCPAVQLAHPDGAPSLFTGGKRTENVTLWDVRACRVVYELSTGNNEVRALAWDDRRSTLYAATECTYIDGASYGYDYRAARVPAWARKDPDVVAAEASESVAGDGDRYEASLDEVRNDGCNWPKHARHMEDFFGFAWDAGWHNLIRYKFKEDPDISVLPEYPPKAY